MSTEFATSIERNEIEHGKHIAKDSPISQDALTESEKEIIGNIINYINDNKERLAAHYLSVKTEDGQNRKKDIYIPIEIEAFQRNLLSVSLVIITANYFESEILHVNHFENTHEKIMKLRGGLQLFRGSKTTAAYLLHYKEYTILHLHAPETGSNTPCGSADLVRYVNSCEYLAASCVISFGVCFGTDHVNYSLGDTIIAEKIYPWSIGIKIFSDSWNIKCDDYIINLRQNAETLFNSINEVVTSTQNLCPNQKARLGNMITSEAVVSNERIKLEAIEKSHGCNIIAGEMEGYGLAKEGIYYSSSGSTACIILKAICDWGVVKNIDDYIDKSKLVISSSYKDQIQAYASYCAYRVLKELLDNVVFNATSVISEVYDSLWTQYALDLAIKKPKFDRCLDDYVEKEMIGKVEKYNNLSPERKDKLKKLIAEQILTEYCTIDTDNDMIAFFK